MKILVLFLLIMFLFSCKSESDEAVSSNSEKLLHVKERKDRIELKDMVQNQAIIDTIYYNPKWNKKDVVAKYGGDQNMLKHYTNYIDESKKDSTIVTLVDNNKSKVKYLGELKLLSTEDVFHVLTDFTILGFDLMPSPRGNSKIIFISDEFNKCIYITLDMPDELPNEIENNQLLFSHDSTEIKLSISEGLPFVFCIPKIGCK